MLALRKEGVNGGSLSHHMPGLSHFMKIGGE